jgi:hypothetical protein
MSGRKELYENRHNGFETDYKKLVDNPVCIFSV